MDRLRTALAKNTATELGGNFWRNCILRSRWKSLERKSVGRSTVCDQPANVDRQDNRIRKTLFIKSIVTKNREILYSDMMLLLLNTFCHGLHGFSRMWAHVLVPICVICGQNFFLSLIAQVFTDVCPAFLVPYLCQSVSSVARFSFCHGLHRFSRMCVRVFSSLSVLICVICGQIYFLPRITRIFTDVGPAFLVPYLRQSV